ncbi:helix-turn-helix domain-containing protein [Paenibacillus harenae]|uniref:AraC-like DNA-binding protein n=1 Tax=Paenibacillus harenae TaxID=306543 RepID=A0ABT9U4V5_PAEHA|nr:AraC family transcriptional regulator [Paenibacillus harenae]MDQ0114603.1 AraC-like DNA-binding protein [Paenibacillus harenae]
MRLNMIRRNGKLYVRLLLGITLSIVLVLLISSSVYYFSFTGILQDKAYESDLSNLRQTGQAVANTTESAQSVAFQIYRNSAIAKVLYYQNPNAFDAQAVMIDLNNYLATMPYIQSIYVYNPSEDRFYISAQEGQSGILKGNEVNDTGIMEILDHYQEYKPFAPIPRIIKADNPEMEDMGVYTYLCYDAISSNKQMNSAVVVNISASWINRELASKTNESTSRTLLVDDRDIVRSVSDLKPLQLSDQDLSLIRSELGEPNARYTIADFEGVKSLISRTSSDQYDWHYVRISPYDEIVKEMKSVRVTTLLIASSVLLAGLFLSWLLSRYLYVPINKIESRMADLESERRNSSYTIRQNILHKLVQIQEFDPQVQLDKLKRADISFDFTKPYQLAYLRIDQFEKLKKNNSKDLLTYKFAIMNIATEICSKHFRVDSIELEDDSILMLLNVVDHSLSETEPLHAMLGEVQAACLEYIHIGISIAVTPVTDNPHQLHTMYKQAKEASYHRFFQGRSAIIETESLPFTEVSYSFPVGKEKRMIDALVAGKIDEAKSLFAEIIGETAPYPIRIVHSAATHITVSLGNMLKEIERNGSLQLGFNAELAVPRIEDFETLEEMTDAYYAFFDLLKSKLVEKRSGKQEDLIRKITHLIETRFTDPNLSLNYVADELNMSSYHISRVYRQQTLTTIVDMINHVRMENAKELLTTTECSVSDIAEKTGYASSSYFHRMFKKIYGVTPSEFRNAHAKK